MTIEEQEKLHFVLSKAFAKAFQQAEKSNIDVKNIWWFRSEKEKSRCHWRLEGDK
jgi:hypothetical protein